MSDKMNLSDHSRAAAHTWAKRVADNLLRAGTDEFSLTDNELAACEIVELVRERDEARQSREFERRSNVTICAENHRLRRQLDDERARADAAEKEIARQDTRLLAENARLTEELREARAEIERLVIARSDEQNEAAFQRIASRETLRRLFPKAASREAVRTPVAAYGFPEDSAVVVCDDGTMWECSRESDWLWKPYAPAIPGTRAALESEGS